MISIVKYFSEDTVDEDENEKWYKANAARIRRRLANPVPAPGAAPLPAEKQDPGTYTNPTRKLLKKGIKTYQENK